VIAPLISLSPIRVQPTNKRRQFRVEPASPALLAAALRLNLSYKSVKPQIANSVATTRPVGTVQRL
jgi:hypothetical protein